MQSKTKSAKRKLSPDAKVADSNIKKLKVTRCATKNNLFTINIPQPRIFRQMIDQLSSVLTEVNIQIISTADTINCQLQRVKSRDSFSGFYIECIDNSHCCIIIIKLEAEVVLNCDQVPSAEQMRFCVSVPVLLNHLKSIDPKYCIQLSKNRTDMKLHMNVCSSIMGRHFQKISIDTLNKDDDPFDISDIDYDITIEFCLSMIRNIIRTAKNVGATVVRFRVMKPTNVTHGSCAHSYFLIHVYGTSSYTEHCFCSKTQLEERKGSPTAPHTMVITNSDITAIEDVDPSQVKLSSLKTSFNELFTVDYLLKILKAMDRSTITLQMSPTKPLIVTNSWGSEHSFISFVLSPRLDDREFPDEVTTFSIL